MIGDMMIRLSKEPNNPLSDLRGIVLIDEIDAHLHPKYQYELPNLLSEIFPKVQFIVTTHSPLPILGSSTDKKQVILTVERNPKQGITVQRKDDFDIRQLNPSSLLTSPIFGLQTLFAKNAKHDDIIASDDFKDVEKVAKIKKRLQELRQQGFIK
jgi:predicted ATP-binding protein involved in virulence